MKLVGKTYHIAVGTALVGVIFALGVFLPQARQFSRLESQVSAAEASVSLQTQRLAKLAQTHQALEQERERLAVFEAAVPAEDEMGDFLKHVDRIAGENGLEEVNVVPAPAIVVGQVRCRPIEMSFHGRFDSVFGFVRQIESLPRVAAIQRIELDAAKELEGDLIASLTVHVFSRRS